jgi:hypothetical protein
MANDLTTGSPLIFDTAGATSVYDKRIGIQAIKWDAVAAADDVCLLLDKAGGHPIFADVASAKSLGKTITFPQGVLADGLYLETLGSGKLYVYLSYLYGG